MKYGAGAPVKIKVTSSNGGGLVSVADHGLGIAKEEHSKIFDRFERAVSHHNISGLGRGSTFTVHLPASPKSRV